MIFKRFPENDYVQKKNSYLESIQQGGTFSSIPSIAQSQKLNFTAPGPIPPRKGRFLAIILSASILGYCAYSIWNTYLRYDSFGIVDATKIGVYSTNSGFISELNVEEGSQVFKGDTVALIVNPEDQRNLKRIEDELAVAIADLESKKNEVYLANENKTDTINQIKGIIAVEEGMVGDLQTKLKLAKSEVVRLNSLIKINAASSHEMDVVLSQVKSSEALIVSKKKYIESLEERIKSSQDLLLRGNEILTPQEKKISLLQNELHRAEEKISEGRIISPVNGKVSYILHHVGEKVSDDSLFTVVVDDTTNMVLFYDPSDKIPDIGSTIDVLSLSQGKKIASKVVAISNDVIAPPDQIRRNYSIDQKLVKVYLEPSSNNANSLIVGSVIKKPKPQDIFSKSIEFVFNLFQQNSLAKTLSE